MHRLTVRAVVAVILSVASWMSLVPAVEAQLGRPRATSTEPNYWVGLSLGYVDRVSMSDNASGASWDFGSATQLRATLEKKLDVGVTGGISAGFSTVPLTYTPALLDPRQLCLGGCQANADVTQYTVFIRGGGGPGFHGLYNAEGGVTQFSNFREQGTSDQLAPTKGSYDLTFGFGGGFAYGLSTNADIYAAETLQFILHKQLSTTTTSAPRVYMLRGGMRFGF